MDMGMHMHHTAPADGETATDPVCGMTVAVNATRSRASMRASPITSAANTVPRTS